MITTSQQKFNNSRGLAIRLVAAKLLGAVIDHQTALDGLTDQQNGRPQYLALTQRDRALCRAIVGCVLRRRADVDQLLNKFLTRPLPNKAKSLRNILYVGIVQLAYLKVPDHAAIDLAVTAAKIDPRTVRFTGLVNALLRKIAADRLTAKTAMATNRMNIHSSTLWFQRLLINDYGDKCAAAILDILSEPPPIDLTVKGQARFWADELGGHLLPSGSVRLSPTQQAVTELYGFDRGEWWVQDAASALPVRLFGNVKGKRVADLCAAPGGKTAQLAVAGAKVMAMEISANRMTRLQNNMNRLKLSADYWLGDFTEYRGEEKFDAVLLDAPCSSTGTVRRHPDILYTKNYKDIESLAVVQERMLDKALDLVKPRGCLVFSNCSLAKIEGETVVNNLLSRRQDVRIIKINATENPELKLFTTSEGYLRTTPADWPHENKQLAGLDGFFAAKFEKL